MGSGKAKLSVEEIIALLKNTSLPTLITEGRDDYIVFRRIEDSLHDIGLDVLPVGEKETVLRLYERRADIGDKDICFIVDKDLWVLSGVPDEYSGIVVTEGYSVENDLFRDGPVRDIMTREEMVSFDAELKSYIELYALLVQRHLLDGTVGISVSPHEFFSSPERRESLLRLLPGEVYPDQLRAQCEADHGRLVRGKALMALALRQLSRADRVVKHSRHSIMEQCTVRWGPLMSALRSRIEASFAQRMA